MYSYPAMALVIPSTRRTADLITVGPSAPAELEFSLLSCWHCSAGGPDLGAPSWAQDYLANHRSVFDRVQEFWSDLPEEDWSELLVLAVRSGTLLDRGLERFFKRFEEAAARLPEPGLLAGEEESLRAVLTARLEVLRTDPERRRAYRELLEEHWAIVLPTWEREGLPAVDSACIRFREELERTHDLRAILPANHLARLEASEPLVEAAVPQGKVAVAPVYMGSGGQMVVDLPGTVMIGIGLEMESVRERFRERSQRAAARFKVLSDPTRAAILMTLLKHAYSVTDLAEQFELSQPTVSVHVKMLREAELLESERRGNQTVYSAQRATVQAFIEDAERDVLPAPAASAAG